MGRRRRRERGQSVNFDSALALKSAAGRAKSNVANKLVSMFLHEISRKASLAGGGNVTSPAYSKVVVEEFGHRCLYYSQNLEHDRAAVEHLDGMNRFRVGLHIPGNVAVACKCCNNEKRRDDQKHVLTLATAGWQFFLSHDGSRCSPECKTCEYWSQLWPDAGAKINALKEAVIRIQQFRLPFSHFIQWSDDERPVIQKLAETLYRSCQDFATNQIEGLTSKLDFDFAKLAAK